MDRLCPHCRSELTVLVAHPASSSYSCDACRLTWVAIPHGPPNVILTEQETADYLGCTVRYLRHLRSVHRGPAYASLGRETSYATADLDRWWDKVAKVHTSES